MSAWYGSLLGIKVIVTPDIPKMRLSDEVIPGEVQWPPGFKAEMDAWLLSFFGTTNILADNEVLGAPGQVSMNPRTYEKFKQSLPTTKGIK